jgi:hypothetical protein
MGWPIPNEAAWWVLPDGEGWEAVLECDGRSRLGTCTVPDIDAIRELTRWLVIPHPAPARTQARAALPMLDPLNDTASLGRTRWETYRVQGRWELLLADGAKTYAFAWDRRGSANDFLAWLTSEGAGLDVNEPEQQVISPALATEPYRPDLVDEVTRIEEEQARKLEERRRRLRFMWERELRRDEARDSDDSQA